MKMMYEVMAMGVFVVGVVCIFTDAFDLAAAGLAMAAYLQAVANSKAPKE